MRTVSVAFGVCALISAAAPALARDQITVVGSATVYPFTAAVADSYARSRGAKAPVIDITGTVAGISQFCAGVGPSFPDLVNASRRMTAEEMQSCGSNGVGEVVEITIGYDGIVLATHRDPRPFGLTRQQLWRALAAKVPDGDTLADNTVDRWSQIDPSLPDARIEVIGPPPTSGTRDVFIELVMRRACQGAPEATKLPEATRKTLCAGGLREDGRYIEAGEYYNLIVQRLAASSGKPLGLFPFSYLAQNGNQVRGIPIEGVVPTVENIASGSYPLARPLFLYVKAAHLNLVPGLADFVTEYTSERSFGPGGYLADRGLVPLPAAERAAQAAKAATLKSR